MTSKPIIVVQLAEFIVWVDTVSYIFMGERVLKETGEPVKPMQLAELFTNEKKKTNGK